jgi:hypothetical protein
LPISEWYLIEGYAYNKMYWFSQILRVHKNHPEDNISFK